ncbi:hypothetical protein WA026_015590 [Henosepilachna vigintioctopunctata]|uniref:Uncharacterized protein n=1 Tax=Henosepilachna vigintioctopunctata TaxID=420089 RepID=A0AAW1V7E4_9CUCU
MRFFLIVPKYESVPLLVQKLPSFGKSFSEAVDVAVQHQYLRSIFFKLGQVDSSAFRKCCVNLKKFCIPNIVCIELI